MTLATADIDAIERATLEALTPRVLVEEDGWLIATDDGVIGRANSVTVLSQGEDLEPRVADVEARYRAAGLRPTFRLATHAETGMLHELLTLRGYEPSVGVSVQIAQAPEVEADRCELAPAPTQAWASVFTAEGFDPADGSSRAGILTRSPDALYAWVGEGSEGHAAGAASFGRGWVGLHGMRTAQARRGQGLAWRVLATLIAGARERGFDRFYLQVEHGNAAAEALYRKAGFAPAWDYVYWRSPVLPRPMRLDQTQAAAPQPIDTAISAP